uniref:Reverse transcriptase domain-containing protein n=1 Tax=Amphimedon queenslandica TaxID=400682 RepID=A0A1X7TWF1_AMPQE
MKTLKASSWFSGSCPPSNDSLASTSPFPSSTHFFSSSPPLFSPRTLSASPPPPAPATPPISSPSPIPSRPSPPLSFPTGAVLKAVTSFPTDTAPGPTGLRANHLKEALCCPSPSVAHITLLSLSQFASLLGSGHHLIPPPSIAPHLCGATLLACRKKSVDLRPIAIGEVFRRLTSKCLSSFLMPQVKLNLPPYQLGVGSPNGSEALIHSLKIIQADPSIPSDSNLCLQLNFSNDFNSINHERIASEVPGLLLNGWYFDDGILCGSSDDLCSALAIIEEEAPSRGLFLKQSKCLTFIPTGFSLDASIRDDIPYSSEGFILLGSHIGSLNFYLAKPKHRVDKIRNYVSLLPQLKDAHSEFTILRACLSLSKFMCVLRTMPPELLLTITKAFDDLFHCAISNLVGGPVSEWSHLKASLHVRLGGLGLRQAGHHASAMFLSSVHACIDLTKSLFNHSIPPYVSCAFTVIFSILGHSPNNSFEDFNLVYMVWSSLPLMLLLACF